MNIREKAGFIRQQIKLLEAKHTKVRAVRINPRNKFQINWNSFAPVMVKFDKEVPEGSFVIETDDAPTPASHARPS